ncbi:hypothetical protein NX02_09560 [Sphingomonas sanxanigenens DSM 19645 = NX02]|uniref:Uncharacterized protein n=1 Tax=Sphingomonas sanxanigenens DSM 19645 = NX02 TaxID=1123269 RepID=W0ABE6_9SPHN|nr:hypothetical protein NX02_09560 [Sphingomonas sanxanigenens DSM 19645 = NX02]
MQRCKRAKGIEFAKERGIDPLRCPKAASPMHDPMADGDNLMPIEMGSSPIVEFVEQRLMGQASAIHPLLFEKHFTLVRTDEDARTSADPLELSPCHMAWSIWPKRIEAKLYTGGA